jgi:hypothetical protein
MKKILLFLLLTTAVLAVVIYFTADRRQGWVEYADGSRARLLKVHGGAHEPPPLAGQPWSKLAQKLPANRLGSPIREWVGGTTGGEGRSWHHVPVENNGLHLWFELSGSTAVGTGGGLTLTKLDGAIIDAEGWLWLNHGKANSMGTLFGGRLDLYGLDFSAFPRWQQVLEVKIFQGEQTPVLLGSHVVSNPDYLPVAPTNWNVKPLPQAVIQSELEVTLEALTFRPHWRKSAGAVLQGEFAPRFEPALSTVEQQAAGRMPDLWHKVQQSVFDNFGNSSHQGLPPRRPGSDLVPPVQWRIAVELVGDHRSRVASNAFVTLPTGPFPPPGEHLRVVGNEQGIGGISVVEVHLLGPGSAAFTKLAMITNKPPGAAFGDGISRSFSVTDDGQGNRVETLTLSSASPFLAASLKGALGGLWFSCRAENARSGEVRWLGTYALPATAPHFERVFDDRGHVWFSCQQLATNENWNLTFGIHQPREVNFFIDRPEYTKTE